MSASSKHRQPRLRASCDGCFLAKVKCSKARPICSRCLACGIECRYSPSSRAGKPKSDAASHLGHNTSPVADMADMADMAAMAAAAGFSSMTDENGMLYTPTLSGVVGWQNTPGMDGPAATPSRHHSIASELVLLATDDNSAATTGGGDVVYNTSMPWTPPADMSMGQFADASLSGLSMASHAGYSMHASASAGMSWMDPLAIDVFPYNNNNNNNNNNNGHGHVPAHCQPQMPTPASSIASANNYFPSPSTTPILRQSPPSGHKSVPLSSPSASSHHGNGNSSSSSSSYQGCFQGTCACFASCLHSLQALHNASTPVAPPFDVVLALNRNAVDGCSAMLSCARCMSRSGTHTAAMLLATVIGKVTSFYKIASQSYFTTDAATASSLDAMVGGLDCAGPSAAAAAESSLGPASISSPPGHTPGHAHAHAPAALLTGLGVSLGAYHLQGEEGRWFELEILNRELKKLEDVYSRFREVCGELSEDVEVSKAMIGYLGHNLGSTLNMVSRSKGDMRYI